MIRENKFKNFGQEMMKIFKIFPNIFAQKSQNDFKKIILEYNEKNSDSEFN